MLRTKFNTESNSEIKIPNIENILKEVNLEEFIPKFEEEGVG